ncbi:porin family protein [Sinomicrobium sp.]
MKTTFLAIAAVIGFAFFGNAQNLHFGAKGGVNFASISDVDADGRTGFHLGLVGEVGLGKFSIQPEVLYSAQGLKDLNLDYLNIPVLAKYYVVQNFSLMAGPQFGFNTKDDDISEIKSFDMGGAVGVEYKIGSLFAQARYNFGLSDVADGGSGKNSVFQISLGYLFF